MADRERRKRAAHDNSITQYIGEGFTQRISFTVGYDHRRFPEDCGGGGHGREGMEMAFLLQGPAGAASWTVALSDLVPGSVAVYEMAGERFAGVSAREIMLHSAAPMEGGTERECYLMPDGRCWWDMTYIGGEPILDDFATNGLRAVWAALHDWYDEMAKRAAETVA